MFEHLQGIWRYRYFWLSLVKLDLMTRYRKSYLGIGWSLLTPLAMTSVFCVVFSELGGGTGGWRAYAQDTLAGLTMWEFLRSCMSQGCHALLRSESYIRQAPLPYSIYPLRTVLSAGFHFSMGLIVLIGMVLILNERHSISVSALMIIPIGLMGLIFGWAVATILAFFTAFFQDIAHVVDNFLQVMFFLTPIFYKRDLLKHMAWAVDLNPFALFIELLRSILIEGNFGPEGHYINLALFTSGAFLLAIGTIAWLQKKVIFHM